MIRTACLALLLLFLLSSAPTMAQSDRTVTTPVLTIDKIDRQDYTAQRDEAGRQAARQVPFITLFEGVVSDPQLAVYVLVMAPGQARERVFSAAIDTAHPDDAGNYRWRAVCQFGSMGDKGGKGTAGTYQAWAAAIAPDHIPRGQLLSLLKESSIQTKTVRVQRDR